MSGPRGCAEWCIRRRSSMASQQTARAVHSAREAICDGLMDGYGAGSAVVGRSAGRIWLPVRVRTISGVPLSIAISLHLDYFLVGAMSLVIHCLHRGISLFHFRVRASSSSSSRGVRGQRRKPL